MTTTSVITEAEEALLVLDHAGRVRSATDRAAALLGRSVDELSGRLWDEIAVPADITATPREHRLRTVRGVSRLRIVALSLSSGAGAPARLLEPWADSAELAMLRAPDGLLLAVNSAFARKFGRAAAGWEGRDPAELVHPEDIESWRGAVAALAHPPHQAAHEHRWLTSRGWRWLSWEEQAVRSPSGAITATRAVGRDVTRRRLAEEHFQKLASIVEQTQVSIVLTMPDGRVEYVNPRFTQVTGLTLEEIFERDIEVLRSGFATDADYAAFLSTLGEGRPWRGEIQTISKRGEAFWESVQVTAIQDHLDRTTHLLCLREDITDRKLLEAQLRQAQKMEVLGMLAGGISHDFNNLLAIMGGFCELALARVPADDAKLARYLGEIHGASKRASALVRQILSFSRKPEDGIRFVKINQIVDDTVRMLRETLPRNIGIEVEAQGSLPGVRADPNQLQQVLMNLCVNARDAMPGGGTLTLRTGARSGAGLSVPGADAHGQYVTIEVADTGHGMSEEVRARIFEPFYTTKDKNHGTGLGLAVVLGIVTGHGGLINVQSRPGHGTTFSIHLPVLDASGATGGVIEGDAPARLPAGTESILIVEDEEAVRSLLCASLEGAGYLVHGATDGAEALEFFMRREHRVDLVILDLNLPRVGGLQVREYLRRTHPDTRMIIASGHVPPELRENIEQAGDAVIINKPFSLATLGKALRDSLDRVPVAG